MTSIKWLCIILLIPLCAWKPATVNWVLDVRLKEKKTCQNVILLLLPRGPGFTLHTPGYVFVWWPWKQKDSEQQPCHKSELCKRLWCIFFPPPKLGLRGFRSVVIFEKPLLRHLATVLRNIHLFLLGKDKSEEWTVLTDNTVYLQALSETKSLKELQCTSSKHSHKVWAQDYLRRDQVFKKQRFFIDIDSSIKSLKGNAHTNIKLLSSFTHPSLIPQHIWDYFVC